MDWTSDGRIRPKETAEGKCRIGKDIRSPLFRTQWPSADAVADNSETVALLYVVAKDGWMDGWMDGWKDGCLVYVEDGAGG
jgi:hypothetical protein